MPTITDWIQAALTVVLVFVTAVYVWKTAAIAGANREAVDAMRAQTEASLRPYIAITPVLDDRYAVSISITNEGRTPAQDVQLSWDPPYSLAGNSSRSTSVIPAFNQAIPTFPPGTRLYYLLDARFSDSDGRPEDQPLVFTVSASYSFAGKLYSESTTIDLRMFSRAFPYTTANEREMKTMAEATARVADELTEISKSLSRNATS